MAEADRNPIERIAVMFNVERQLGFAAALRSDLDQGQHTVFAGGRMHTLALTRWFEHQTDSGISPLQQKG